MKHDETARTASGNEEAVLLQLVAQLETQLGEIDALGVHLAAAHLDAAIARLRRAAHQQRLG